MKIFVSWSGPLSHAIAQAFAAWLPTVIQECRQPFVSSDIAKGEAWFQAITEELVDSKIGVAFITNENHTSPWLHFEGGAMLTKLEKQRICPVVVDLAKADYDGPLKNLQLTDLVDKADFFKLLTTISSACDHPLDNGVLRDTFELRWPALEEKVAAARAASEADTPEIAKAQRTPDEKIDEILGLVREIRADSPGPRRKPSAEERLTAAELNRRILELNDASAKWGQEKVAEFISDNGDVVSDKITGEEFGTLVDIKDDSKGGTWILAQPKDGARISKRMDEVIVSPF